MIPELTLGDRQEISELSARYACAVDRRDFALLADVFAAEAVLDSGRGVRRGASEIIVSMQRLNRYDATFHLVGQCRLGAGASAGTATGEVYCEAHHLRTATVGTRSDSVMYIRYHDRYEAGPDGWRIAERRLETLWTDNRLLT